MFTFDFTNHKNRNFKGHLVHVNANFELIPIPIKEVIFQMESVWHERDIFRLFNKISNIHDSILGYF